MARELSATLASVSLPYSSWLPVTNQTSWRFRSSIAELLGGSRRQLFLDEVAECEIIAVQRRIQCSALPIGVIRDLDPGGHRTMAVLDPGVKPGSGRCEHRGSERNRLLAGRTSIAMSRTSARTCM